MKDYGLAGDVGVTKCNSSGDTVRADTEEIHEEPVIFEQHIEPVAFGSQIQIEKSQHTVDAAHVVPACKTSNDRSPVLVGDKTVELRPDEGVSSTSINVGVVDQNQERKEDAPDDVHQVAFHVQLEHNQIQREKGVDELDDSFFPTQNTVAKLVMKLRKDRRPGPSQVSPFVTNFGSASG
ncbi:uncharacterized protein LOC132639625 [Lycium barbarum]|uniref:uncharacterized protein LOC132639625 n=1 Tax=Lycium barbarum TaxID=112863 RepID=UPI00293E17F6|nr:uncharacterized protein LOC132639625 [Lycium barbarum]